ncbi:hypothetical protein BS47DRAFT_1357949 [Hydnum rufescens UP504]|uniref:Uncharacterized protein n=1 Tax=Hydnum rufescens UP504 TaxID=1448309 RepID=A0A9P6B909_9AGAM|nr:hypothetical protein BS47DRAFT_1357949 [Hydnum rufescens UP504]
MRQPNTQQTKRRQTTPRQVRTRPPSDHTNHTPTAAGVWFYVRPSPQPQENPHQTNPPSRNNNLRATPNRNLPKPRQIRPRESKRITTHLPKGALVFKVVRLYPQPTQTANRKPPTCQTKPGNRDAQRKTARTPDGTTHPLRRAYTTHRERPKQTTHPLRRDIRLNRNPTK